MVENRRDESPTFSTSSLKTIHERLQLEYSIKDKKSARHDNIAMKAVSTDIN